MVNARLAVELVIQTATALVMRRLAPREAVTILATQAPQARSAAQSLLRTDPDRARTYASLLSSLEADLDRELEGCDDPGDLRAVMEDLQRLVMVLTG